MAHPPPCHSQGTNVTDAVSAASSCSRREILDNEWTFLLLSFKLKTHHTAALGTNRLREGGRLSVKYPPPFYCLGSGLRALTEARLMKVCCLISQIDSVRKTPLPELSDTIHLLDDIPQR